MKLRDSIVLSCAAVSLTISGCATNLPAPSEGAQGPVRDVPSLKVVTDCGACQVRPTVPGFIVEGYASAATNAGAKVASGREATVSIKEYAARDDGARFLVGALAGKDEIKAVVTFEGKQFSVEDYYRNAWQGIDALARKIGEMAFERIEQYLTSSTPKELGSSAAVVATPASTSPSAQSASVAERLRVLNKLYKDGLINQVEFESKKQEILKSM